MRLMLGLPIQAPARIGKQIAFGLVRKMTGFVHERNGAEYYGNGVLLHCTHLDPAVIGHKQWHHYVRIHHPRRDVSSLLPA